MVLADVRSLFVFLYFLFLPLCCLFFDLRILIAPFDVFKLFLHKHVICLTLYTMLTTDSNRSHALTT